MTSRRTFLSALGATAGAAASIDSAAAALLQPRASRPAPVKPRRLRPGDTVGLVTPASATFFPVDVDIAEEALTAMGLKVRRGPHILDRHGFLAGRDRDRAADINAFFADPGIAGIVALRGGWGCARLLPYLDYPTIARNPKVVLGYSDITALLNAVYAKAGLVTFHGPVAVSRWNSFNFDYLKRVIFQGEAVTFRNVKEVEDGELAQRRNRIRTVTGGRAQGRLLGGNLTVLTAMLGSPYVPDFSGAILFLEDTNEAPYRIDRMMTQLKLAGVLDQVKGLVFGECTECDPGEGSYGSLTLEEILVDHVKPLGIPAWHGAMVGHIPKQFTLPVGIPVEIDADRGAIRMLEPGVA